MRTRTQEPSKKTNTRKPRVPRKPKTVESLEAKASTELEISRGILVNAGIPRERLDAYYALPKITHILNASLPNGFSSAVEFLCGSDEDEARKFVDQYNKWMHDPKVRDALLVGRIPIEAFCFVLEITPKRMLEVIQGAVFEQSDLSSNLMASARHPDVVRETINSALLPGREGHQDRKLMHLHHRFIPTAQTTIIGKGGVQNNTQDNSKNVNINVPEIPVGQVKSTETTLAKLANRFNERMGLGAAREDRMLGPAEEAPIEAEVVE